MSSIDARIVEMKFNNGQFEKGIKETTSSLDGLKKSLSLDGAKAGLEKLQDLGRNFSLSNIASGIDNIASKFTALSAIGAVALGNLASSAIQSGIQIVKSLTVAPINDGLKEYETNLNAIQTILANTSSKGTTLDQVNGALKELNDYSDKTIYNFSEMARNIGTFTAAGVNLETSTAAIKGIANLAAVSGSNSQQASTAMYQLSQALSTGRVSLMDWNSVVNAGMGGQVFQDAIKETARVHGVAIDSIISEQGSFRDSLQTGWLTSDILTETLSKFTGDLNADQLRTMGYNEEQIVGILKMGQTAQDAATKVKTMSQLIGTLQESAASGWAQTWQLVFGDFEEAKTLFTNVNNVLGGMIGASADARNKMLEDWKVLGGRTALIDAVSNAFEAVMAVIKPISQAFKEIFPPTTGRQLYEISMAIKTFTEGLKISGETSQNLKSTFKGFFAVLDIGWMIIKQVVKTIASLFPAVSKTSGGVLEITGNIGDFLVKVRDAIKNGETLGNIFGFIGSMLRVPIDFINKLGSSMSANGSVATGWAGVWENIVNVFKAVWTFVKPVVDWFVDAFAVVKTAVTDAFKSMDFNSLMLLLNAGLLTGGIVIIKKFIDAIKKAFGGIGGDIVTQIKTAFGELTKTMEAMQGKLKAETLMRIAAAIAILTAAIVVLSFIDIGRLATALGAITVMFAQLMGVMYVFEKMGTTQTALKMTIISASLILLSTAMVIFAAAVKIMSSMDWNELARGLSGMAVGLGIMIGAVKIFSAKDAAMVQLLSGALFSMAVAITVLGLALKIMASLSWDDLARSLLALAGGLGIMILAIKAMSGGDILKLYTISGALISFSIALVILAGALKIMATMSWDEIGRGLAVLAGSLFIITIAMKSMQEAVVGAGAMIVISIALVILAGALKIMGTMSWDEIGRGISVLGASLLILIVAMAAMQEVIVGAAALIIAAGALMILAPALKMMGKMSWDEIGRGLALLASALGIIAVGGVLLIAALPGLLGLGIAAVLIGAGALAAGIGITMLSAGLIALGAASTIGANALVFMATQLIGLIPLIALKVGEGIIAIAGVISTSGPTLIAAFTTVITAMVTSIATTAPLIINTFFDLIMLLVAKLEENVPKFVTSGMNMIQGILQGIANTIGSVVNSAVSIIVNFINAISNNLPRIINAGINLVISFVNGMADGIRRNSQAMRDAGWNLAMAILDGMTAGLGSSVVNKVISAVQGLGRVVINAVKAILGIRSPSKEFYKIGEWSGEGLSNGLTSYTKTVGKDAESLGYSAMDGLKKSVSGISDIALADMDMTPTIRPVLDLSAIKKDSSLITGMLATPTISVDTAYAKASSISVEQRAAKVDLAATDQQATAGGDTNVTFVQNNTSPKALTAAEIYRQTKNQISTAKGVLSYA